VVITSVVTETTAGITLLTTGRKSGKGVLGPVADGNVQVESVYWAELSDSVGLAVREHDRAQTPVTIANGTSIAMARVRFVDIFHRVYYSIATFCTGNPCADSGYAMSNHLTATDLTTRNATLYNEGKPGFTPPVRTNLQDLAFSVLL
jgi:hypothetical protein